MSAAQTRIESLLDVIINNVELQHWIRCEIDPPSDIFSKTRTFILNEDVTDCYELRTNIDHMMAILTDGKYICRKPAAQIAVQNLLKLRNDMFEEVDLFSFPNPGYDPRSCQGQSTLFEDTDWVYPSGHQYIHSPVTEPFDVKAHSTNITQNASGLSEKHKEEETAWSKSKHTEAVKYPIGFQGPRIENLDIQQDTSLGTKFNELFSEASNSCKKMEIDSSEISEKNLFCLQDQIEYLLQAVENIQMSTIKRMVPQKSDLAKVQEQTFQRQFRVLEHMQKMFVAIKESFLQDILMNDWQYMTQKQVCEYLGLPVLDLPALRLKSKEGAFIYSYRDIFYQNDEKCKNVYVKSGGWNYKMFFKHLVSSWCYAYSRKQTLSSRMPYGEYVLDNLYDTLKEFEFVFLISPIDMEADVCIHEMITTQLLLEGENFSIFKQVLFRESEKCLFILQQPNVEIRGAGVSRAAINSNRHLPLRRPMHNYVVLTRILTDENLELGNSDKLLHFHTYSST